jgi:hypothetical protein
MGLCLEAARSYPASESYFGRFFTRIPFRGFCTVPSFAENSSDITLACVKSSGVFSNL